MFQSRVYEMKYVRIPAERVPVLIGRNGRDKKKVEKVTGIKLNIDSNNSEITIDPREARDPIVVLKIEDYIRAVGRGFSPENASVLLTEDDYFLQIIDIKDYSDKPNRIRELRGRVIGTNGKTRKIIEELTGVMISVYGHTVSIIGDSMSLPCAFDAVDMILSGSPHSAVYSMLERKSAKLKIMKKINYHY